VQYPYLPARGKVNASDAKWSEVWFMAAFNEREKEEGAAWVTVWKSLRTWFSGRLGLTDCRPDPYYDAVSSCMCFALSDHHFRYNLPEIINILYH
jgi:hypothetical protein